MSTVTGNMNREVIERKKRFKAALALAGMTQKEWAAQQGEKQEDGKPRGVTKTHLNEVLNRNRDSEPLNAAIDAFIEKIERRARAKAAA